MMRTIAVWIGACLMAGGLWSVSLISQGLADEPTAPSSSSEATKGTAGNETGGSKGVPPVVEGEPALPAEAGEVQSRDVPQLVRIQNHWKPYQYVHIQNGPVAAGPISVGWTSARWYLELIPGSTVYRIQNVWQGDRYLNIESGSLQASAIQPGWVSARWLLEPVAGTVPTLYRIRNVWKPDQYLNIESGALQASAIQPGWLSAMWTLSFDATVVAAPAPPPVVQPPPTGGVPGITGPTTGTLAPVVSPPPAPSTFSVKSYGGKCLDFGAPPQVGGAPVFIYTCNGTIAQQVVVQEINARHEVILRAGTLVIGVKGVSGAATVAPPVLSRGVGATAEAPLELQIERDRLSPTLLTSAAGQIFALDGDSIILAADRTRVVKVLNNRGTDRTPLVLGSRDLADNEFWTFVATDKSGRYPTSGFVRVAKKEDFLLYVLGDPMRGIRPAGPGTVIEVDPNATIDLSNVTLLIPDGVTIRSDRRGTNLGAALVANQVPSDSLSMIRIDGNDVRITGLRLRGPSSSTDEVRCAPALPLGKLVCTPVPPDSGIYVAEDLYTHSIIDHNDLSGWPSAAVKVQASEIGPDFDQCGPSPPPNMTLPPPRPEKVRVAHNFIHHNQMQGTGYGVVVGQGGYVVVKGNTFVSNRHAIAASGTRDNSYRAWDNLVLQDTPEQHNLGASWHTQDFDMHGTGDGGFGGTAGDYIEIARNTFLGTKTGVTFVGLPVPLSPGTTHPNFHLRGTPCFQAEYHDNVSREKLEEAINNDGDKPVQIWNNKFESANPTDHLGVGDFDGDGVDDLFLATGAAWYYAPAGMAEWRFLNAQPDGIGTLLFGDFDADGRTDVFTQHGRDWLVSWAGASPWEKINESNPALSEFRIGDFVGDQRADVFYSDGQAWYVSDGGVGMFAAFINRQGSGFRTADLGFGDFNGDGKTDVVGVVGGQWKVSLNAMGPWGAGFPPLRPALTKTMAGLMIADFNGDRHLDIATAELVSIVSGKSAVPAWKWKISWAGTSDWKDVRMVYGPPVGVGRFDATPGPDILVWESTSSSTISILSSGVGAPIRYSPQEMR